MKHTFSLAITLLTLTSGSQAAICKEITITQKHTADGYYAGQDLNYTLNGKTLSLDIEAAYRSRTNVVVTAADGTRSIYRKMKFMPMQGQGADTSLTNQQSNLSFHVDYDLHTNLGEGVQATLYPDGDTGSDTDEKIEFFCLGMERFYPNF